MICNRCGHHRPGLNTDGICPSCVRFGAAALPQAVKNPQPRPAPQNALRGIADILLEAREKDAQQAEERRATIQRHGCPVCGRPSEPDAYFLCAEHFSLAAKCIRDAGVQDWRSIESALRRIAGTPKWADEDWAAGECRAAAFRVKFSGPNKAEHDRIAPPASRSVVPASAAATAVPPSSEARKLAAILESEGFPVLAQAVLARRVPELDEDERLTVAEYAQRVRSDSPIPLDVTAVRAALVEVTTAGWGNEADTTLPGAIQPLMQLD